MLAIQPACCPGDADVASQGASEDGGKRGYARKSTARPRRADRTLIAPTLGPQTTMGGIRLSLSRIGHDLGPQALALETAEGGVVMEPI